MTWRKSTFSARIKTEDSMDSRLTRLIKDYQSAVAYCLEILEANGIPRPASSLDWVTNDIPGSAEFSDGTRYHKHGAGCAVTTDRFTVDFDFGEQGQIDGFDLWRLNNFARGRLVKYGVSSDLELKSLFETACKSGELTHSGYILWYLAQRNDL